MDQEAILVGDAECPLGRIINAMMLSNTSHIFSNKWEEVALCFGTEKTTLKNIHNKITNRSLTACDAFEVLLLEWRSRQGHLATLSNLKIILMNNGMGVLADALTLCVVPSHQNEQQEVYTSGSEMEDCLTNLSLEEPNSNKMVDRDSVDNSVNQITCVKLMKFQIIIHVLLIALVMYFTQIVVVYLMVKVHDDKVLYQHQSSLQFDDKFWGDELTCESYTQCKTYLEIFPNGTGLSLNILVVEPEKWEAFKNLNFTEKFSNISIFFNVLDNTVLGMLSQFNKAVRISLHANDNYVTKPKNMSFVFISKTSFLHLKHLELRSFSKCQPIFSFFSQNCDLMFLEHLYIKESLMTIEDIMELHHVLIDTKYSLKELAFFNTTWDYPLFHNFYQTLYYIDTIHIGFSSANFTNVSFFENFAIAVPELKRLYVSEYIKVDLDQLKDILRLSKLEAISINIILPENQTEFSFAIFAGLLNLHSISIYIEFFSHLDCRIDKNQFDLKKLQVFSIETNCFPAFQ